MKNSNKKFLVESARITNAYLAMHNHINESSDKVGQTLKKNKSMMFGKKSGCDIKRKDFFKTSTKKGVEESSDEVTGVAYKEGDVVEFKFGEKTVSGEIVKINGDKVEVRPSGELEHITILVPIFALSKKEDGDGNKADFVGNIDDANESCGGKKKTSSKKKMITEGAGAGYDIHIKGLKLGKIVEKKIVKGEERFEDFYECKVEVVPGEYEIGAEDYYNDFFGDLREYGEVATATIDGGIATITYGVQWDDEEESERDLRNQVEDTEVDITFSYSFGWIHQDLPEKIVVDRVKIDSNEYFEIVGLELVSHGDSGLASVVNYAHEHMFDEEDEANESYDDNDEVDYGSDGESMYAEDMADDKLKQAIEKIKEICAKYDTKVTNIIDVTDHGRDYAILNIKVNDPDKTPGVGFNMNRIMGIGYGIEKACEKAGINAFIAGGYIGNNAQLYLSKDNPIVESVHMNESFSFEPGDEVRNKRTRAIYTVKDFDPEYNTIQLANVSDGDGDEDVWYSVDGFELVEDSNEEDEYDTKLLDAEIIESEMTEEEASKILGRASATDMDAADMGLIPQNKADPYNDYYEENDDDSEEDDSPSNDEIAAEYKEFLGNREPCVETSEGVIYFEYDPDRNVLAYGSATNTGLAESGHIDYDKGDTMLHNLEHLHDEIYDKFGYPEEDEEVEESVQDDIALRSVENFENQLKILADEYEMVTHRPNNRQMFVGFKKSPDDKDDEIAEKIINAAENSGMKILNAKTWRNDITDMNTDRVWMAFGMK